MTPPLIPHAHATLHAGGLSIDYVRAGCGETLVLLQPGVNDGAASRSLLDELAREHRVVAPVMRSTDAFSTTLECLLEALGVERAGLVATAEFREPAREFVATHPGRIASLVLL